MIEKRKKLAFSWSIKREIYDTQKIKRAILRNYDKNENSNCIAQNVKNKQEYLLTIERYHIKF